MKRWTDKPALIAALLLAVYLLGLALGTYSILIYPSYHRQKNALRQRGQAIANEYLEGSEGTLEFLKSPTLRIVIYGADGACLRRVMPLRSERSESANAAVDAYLSDYLPSVLEGQSVFDMTRSYETPNILTRFMLVEGEPIIESGSVVGAVFLVKQLENLQEACLAFLVCFSVLYLVFTCLVVAYMRKKRKLEEMQKNYIANVTHALKSPIASIKAIAETLSDVPNLGQDKQIFYYGMILREANLQVHMVQEILDLSKLQSSGKSIIRSSVSASEAFEPVLQKFSALCDCAHLAFCVSENIAMLPALYSNALCLQQLLEILLENSIKYMDDGGIVRFDAAAEKNYVLFSVRDSGPGIAKEDIPHVFERFYRCSGNPKGGSGLGLAIAKEIVTSLGEKIWVESENGKGSTFFFTVRTA